MPRGIKGVVRDVDQMLYLTTGMRLRQVITPDRVGRVVSRMVPLLRNTPAPAPVDPNDPYYILGVNPAHSTRVIKATFRALSFDLHPDTGEHPDAVKFKAAVDAYNRIMKEREGNGG